MVDMRYYPLKQKTLNLIDAFLQSNEYIHSSEIIMACVRVTGMNAEPFLKHYQKLGVIEINSDGQIKSFMFKKKKGQKNESSKAEQESRRILEQSEN